jgi:hypothetical protein
MSILVRGAGLLAAVIVSLSDVTGAYAQGCPPANPNCLRGRPVRREESPPAAQFNPYGPTLVAPGAYPQAPPILPPGNYPGPSSLPAPNYSALPPGASGTCFVPGLGTCQIFQPIGSYCQCFDNAGNPYNGIAQ